MGRSNGTGNEKTRRPVAEGENAFGKDPAGEVSHATARRRRRRQGLDPGRLKAAPEISGSDGRRRASARHFGADLLAQHVDGDLLPVALEVPVGPAIA